MSEVFGADHRRYCDGAAGVGWVSCSAEAAEELDCCTERNDPALGDELEQTISVRYSCAACGIAKVSVAVPARQSEDVKDWVEKIMAQAISDDHTVRSPRCTSRTMSEVMIPVSGTDRIGGAPVN